jgi:GNAT superfamily N-acetyltransferase
VEDCRLATLDDLQQIVIFARLLREELGAMRGGRLWVTREARAEPLEETYAELLGRDDAHVVMGTIDGTPIGFGAAEVELLRTGERLGVITELFVEPEARAVGVGEAMAAALVAFCTERGCLGVDARALPGHRAAKNFFEEQGFTARALVMHHVLDPPPPASE